MNTRHPDGIFPVAASRTACSDGHGAARIKILSLATPGPHVSRTAYDLGREGAHQGSTTMRSPFSYVVLTSDMPR